MCSKYVLRATNSLDDVRERLFGERKRPEVVGPVSVKAAKAQVIGDPRRLDRGGKVANSLEVVDVERLERANRKRNPVKNDLGILPDAAEHRSCPAAPVQKVLRDRFDARRARTVLE